MLSQSEQDILFQTNMVKIYSVFETTKTPHKPYAAHTCKAHTREYLPVSCNLVLRAFSLASELGQG